MPDIRRQPDPNFPRISFGIIVLNGEPFTRYCLRSIYPFAFEIFVVEGASSQAAEISTADGHSLDSTLETLRSFQINEDPEKKLQIITKDGFWSEKDEQSQAYAAKATGDYLWQVDIDEFYHPEDLNAILKLLAEDSQISGASFYWENFWGGFDYQPDGWKYRDALREINGIRRIFRWGKGYQYVSHRPPTVLNDSGKNLCELKWIAPREMARRKIFIYHYGMLLPKQAREKTLYYKKMWKSHETMDEWFVETFQKLNHPFKIMHGFDPPSWLTRFRGKHPPEIEQLKKDLQSGAQNVELRKTDDIEKLLQSFPYAIVVCFLRILYPFVSPFNKLRNFLLWPFKKVQGGLRRLKSHF